MEEVRGMITEAIQFHIEGLREDGVVVPLPSSTAVFIDVATA
jgi:predicted RNase H-like HicB family nuclease